MSSKNKIEFAYYLDGWKYEGGDKVLLKKNASRIVPSEYAPTMKGNIFCPECCVNLYRSPEEDQITKSGRIPFYAHTSKYSPNCSLRTKKSEGKRYDNEAQAKQAIEDEELVIVKRFMKERPSIMHGGDSSEYSLYPNERADGGLSRLPIGRHKGEEVPLPSQITTVRSLCREFDKNLYRYFFLPNQSSAVLLRNLLTSVESIKETCDKPTLYFGKVISSKNRGSTPQNIRQTWFQFKRHGTYVDFCLKATDADSQDHGINDEAVGKFVLMFGRVTESGIGLCIENIGWGEFAVLSDKYAYLLDDNT